PAVAAQPDAQQSVVVAVLRSIRVHNRYDYERARALYVHENSQPAVLEIQRTLLGPPIQDTVVVFMSVDPSSQFKVEWVSSYGLLESAGWNPGDRFVLLLSARDEYGTRCQDFVPTKRPAPNTEADGLALVRDPGFDAELDNYRDAPGYCARL